MSNTITQTHFNFPGQKSVYKGKVREVYTLEDNLLVMISTDRLSAFDVVMPKGIPYKGQILNQIATKMMADTKDIVPNWLIATPDPNVAVGHACEPFKVEMVIRGYMSGHAAREYHAGKRLLCGVTMPRGMKENDSFPCPIITPATKAEMGDHDADISKEDLLAKGIVSAEDYEVLEKYTYALFKRGSELAASRGLILVDTKYEFGKTISGEIVLIDEIHTLVGAGAAEGAIDAASILKPMLARGELQTIGATTLDEYRKHFEKDAALARRFQSIQVDEPSPALAINILKGLRDRYEAHHKVSITDGAIVAAVSMSDRYVTDRFLPDKAIDLIDEAGARLRLSFLSAPPELKEMQEKVAVVRQAKEQAIADQDFEAAATKRDEEKKLTAEKVRMEKEFRDGSLDTPGVVDEALIAEVIAQATGIPVFKLGEDEGAKLIYMEDGLHKRVIGQEQAIAALSKTIRRQRAGLKDPKRPSGSFIFAGPTGVGKTELAKALAEFLFEDEDALIALDMSEYSEKHTVSRLFGAPPGFVGYEEGGQLTEKIRRKPFSVVLFDEIEKAHPDIFNSLLQILEEGRLTDGQGRVVDFKNTIIIMTTNLGTREITGSTLGFSLEGDSQNDYTQMKGKVNEELKKNFKPEFLNRVDDVIVFPQLSREELLLIVDLFISRLQLRLDDRDLKLTLTLSAKERLIELGFDPTMGARPLRRAVQREIEDSISERILTGYIGNAQDILVDYLDDEFSFVAASREQEPVAKA